MTAPFAAPEAGDRPYPHPAKAWWMVAIMFAASVASVIDRGILTMVVDPVRASLAISDVQISLLQGLSFGIFYAVVGIPLGLSADRLSRRRLLIAGIAVWSGATFWGGLAQSFGALFTARLLVGLGEAALAPCAVSMIADMFPPDRRGRPVSIYLLGQSLAGGLSVMLTGAILGAVPAGRFAWIGWLDGLEPWRVAFLVAGCCGLPVILMLLTLREPARHDLPSGSHPSFAGTVRHLATRWRIFVPFYGGFAALVILAYSGAAWSATYLMRRFAMTPAEIGQWQGGVTMALGIVGALSAGLIVDLVSRRRIKGGKLLFLIVVALLMTPSAFLVLFPSPISAILVIGSTTLLMPMIGTGMVTTLQELLPSTMRGVGVSLFGLFNTITGQTIGPYLVAAIAADRPDSRPGMALGHAMLMVELPAILLAALLYCVTYLGYRRLPATPLEQQP